MGKTLSRIPSQIFKTTMNYVAVNNITKIVTIIREDLFCRCSLRTLKTQGHFSSSFAQSFIRFYGKRAVVAMTSC